MADRLLMKDSAMKASVEVELISPGWASVFSRFLRRENEHCGGLVKNFRKVPRRVAESGSKGVIGLLIIRVWPKRPKTRGKG